MATAKSDDEFEEQPEPVTQERPGLYAHGVGATRRRGQARAESGEVAIGNMASREPITVPGETVEIDQIRPSGLDLADARDSTATELGSENTNHRADLMVVNLPAPPRVPNMTLSGEPLPERRSASLLDAPHSLRPDSLPVRSGPSWLLLGCVAVCSAIIAAAGVVALREPAAPQSVSASPVATLPVAAPRPEEPSGFARYEAEDAAKQAALAAKQAAERAAQQPDAPLESPVSARAPEGAHRHTHRGGAAGRADVSAAASSTRAQRGSRTEPSTPGEQPLVAPSEPAAPAAPPEVTAPAASAEPAAPPAPLAPAAEPNATPGELPPNPYAQ